MHEEAKVLLNLAKCSIGSCHSQSGDDRGYSLITLDRLFRSPWKRDCFALSNGTILHVGVSL